MPFPPHKCQKDSLNLRAFPLAGALESNPDDLISFSPDVHDFILMILIEPVDLVNQCPVRPARSIQRANLLRKGQRGLQDQPIFCLVEDRKKVIIKKSNEFGTKVLLRTIIIKGWLAHP